MPSVELRIPSAAARQPTPVANPLPSLLQTPSGLAIIEIQGTIHTPAAADADADPTSSTSPTLLGRLEFPLYDAASAAEGKWMKKVYLYVGKHQRLTGEAKKLGKPLAVIRKAEPRAGDVDDQEVLEVVEIVKYKLLFSGRPEPVGE